jgi:c-di-GMP-binding flagellar brake protein YcgR
MGEGMVEVPTSSGLVEFDAHVALDGGMLVLRPQKSAHAQNRDAETVPGDAQSETQPVAVQRREDVRGSVELRVRGAVVTGPEATGDEELALSGATLTLSAGGISAQVETSAPHAVHMAGRRAPRPPAVTVPAGTQAYVEVEMPDGLIVPSIVEVVAFQRGLLRAKFLEIASVDRERLVRLVFAAQRRELAQRRKASGSVRTGPDR